MMKKSFGRGFCISFESPIITDESVYKTFYQVFSSYGNVNKQYIDYNKKSGFVYYDDKGDAENAYTCLKKRNNYFITVSRPVPAQENFSDSDVEVSAGTDYFDVFGQKVPVLTSDEGATYISLEHLQDKCGFKLFKTMERNITKQNLEDRFKWFMYNQAYVFLQMNQCHFEKYFVDDFINWIMEKANGTQMTNSKPLSSKPMGSTDNCVSNNYSRGNNSFYTPKREETRNELENGRSCSKISAQNEGMSKNSIHRRSTSSLGSQNSNKERYQEQYTKQPEKKQEQYTKQAARNQEQHTKQPEKYQEQYRKQPLKYQEQSTKQPEKYQEQYTKQPAMNQEQHTKQPEKYQEQYTKQPARNQEQHAKQPEKYQEQLTKQPGKYQEQHTKQPEKYQEQYTKPEQKPEQNLKSLSNRSCITDSLKGTNGIIQCIRIKDEEQFIGFIIPSTVDALDKINEIENIEAGEYDTNFKPVVGSAVVVDRELIDDKICLWSRATVLKVVPNGFVVALIDFGNILQVKKVYKTSEKYNNLPEFIALCKTSKDVVSIFTNDFEIEYESNENNRATIILNKTKYEVTCTRWNPFIEDLSISEQIEQPQEVIKSIKPSTELNENVQVKLLGESNGLLSLRSFNDSKHLKKMTEEMAEHKLVKLQSPPITDQIVLHLLQNKLYRATVIEIKENSVSLQNIDYDTNHVVEINSLYYADNFAKRNTTLTHRYLKGYTTFSEKAKDYLQECFNKVKFVVHSVDDETVDLMYEKDHLSDIIKKVDNWKSGHLMEENLPEFKLPNDSVKMMVVHTDNLNKGQLVFYPTDDTSTDGFFEVNRILDSYESHAIPLNLHVGELCVAKYEDDWCRAVVREIDESNNTCSVYYLDYGNKSSVSCDDIREFSEELTHLAPMAVHCQLKDFIDETDTVPAKIFSKLDKCIEPMEVLKLQVIQHNDNNVYDISIPSLALKLFK